MSTSVFEVGQFLESLAPLHLQENYDNSGLIIGHPEQTVTGIIICLDCTEEVIDEAIRMGCNMIISHHPPVFYGLKKITGSNYTERIVLKAIKEEIALYAIHTNLDNIVSSGVNERIARQLGVEIEGILRPSNGIGPGIETGAGIIGFFSEPVLEVEFLQLLKERMKTEVIRHSRLLGKPVQRIAICGGSGS